MKKIIVFACALVIAISSFANENKVSDKALKAFENTFADAENVTWTTADNIYSVTFTQQGIKTFVNYDEQGNFIDSRRYYAAAKLPIDIQCKIKKSFPDKTVFGVSEFTIADEVYYFVKLEGSASWTTIKINNARSVEVVESFLKP